MNVAYEQSRATAGQGNRCLLEAFARFGVPTSLADLGCGPGHMVELAVAMGVVAYGIDIEIEKRSPHYIRQGDLTKPIEDPQATEMVLCLEVGEHLPASAAPTLCDNIARALAPNGLLLFSAATPGQGGSGHLNEQPTPYWSKLLRDRGLVEVIPSTVALRRSWSEVAPAAWWYGQNVMVFRRSV